jgi:hypothetical protein
MNILTIANNFKKLIMEDFTSKIQIRFNGKIVDEFKNLNFLTIYRKNGDLKEGKEPFLKVGMEIWQIQHFTKNNKIIERKLYKILKINYEKKINNKKIS